MASRFRPGINNYQGSNYQGSAQSEAPIRPAAVAENTHSRNLRDDAWDREGEWENNSTLDRVELDRMLAAVPVEQREMVRREYETRRGRELVDTRSSSRTDRDSLPPNASTTAETFAGRDSQIPMGTRPSPGTRRSISDREVPDDSSPMAGSLASNTSNRDTRQLPESGYGAGRYSMSAHNDMPAGSESDRSSGRPSPIQEIALGSTTANASLPQPIDAPQPTVEESPQVVPASHSDISDASQDLPAEEPRPELNWREHIQQALLQLEGQSSGSPEEQRHLAMADRMLHLSLGDLNAAMEPIDGLQENGQKYIQHTLESLYEVTNPNGNPIEVKRYTLAMLSQRKAHSYLAAASNLEVRNAAFCTEVDGFGVVTKFPKYDFNADQELLLYCELDNFVSTYHDGKGYETQLQGSYEIIDAGGRRVADQLLPMDSHLCRNQRRDYFIAYRIYMPQDINLGRYQLKLVIEDMKGRKFGQSSLDFQIVQ